MRLRIRSVRALLFSGWHCVDVHSIPIWRCSTVFLSVSGWWGLLEPFRQLIVTSPPVFAHYSGYCMCDGRPRAVIMEIAVRELLFMTDLSFLAASSSSFSLKTTNDERILTNDAVLLPLPAGYFEHIDVDFLL